MKIRYELSYLSFRDGSRKYLVTFYSQPWWWHLTARAYHAYEMNKIVHWISHRIERNYGHLTGEGYQRDAQGRLLPFETEPTPFTMPHCAIQSERCHRLREKGKISLAQTEMTETEYNAIKRGGRE